MRLHPELHLITDFLCLVPKMIEPQQETWFLRNLAISGHRAGNKHHPPHRIARIKKSCEQALILTETEPDDGFVTIWNIYTGLKIHKTINTSFFKEP